MLHPRNLSPVFLAMFLPAAPLAAAEAGAWETFSTAGNVNAWGLFDWADFNAYALEWENSVPGDEFVYSFHIGGAALEFFTEIQGNAGGGKLMGDYAAENIQGILVDALIADLATFDQIDCSIYTTGPAGARLYFSTSYYNFEFPGSGWFGLRFGFEETWYYFDDVAGSYVPVELTAESITDIEWLSFRFFRTAGAGSVAAAIDDVKLQPRVTGPALAASHTATDFELAFTPGNGIQCSVEKLLTPSSVGWETVAGQTGITGTTPHVFSTPLLPAGRGIFRVNASELYTPFVTAP
ncbi:hypothetical protein [Luteolibacter marinus]|uniref:hypothetical protein n=1 Tax=Luteolibacter marinus TaxID=2776705 RepID=UPI00186873D5|nr:hypothetical protein [Luteolibacter marinus]